MNTLSTEYTERTYPELQKLDLFNLPVSQAARDYVARQRGLSEAYRNGDWDYKNRYNIAGAHMGVVDLLMDHFRGDHSINDPTILQSIERIYLWLRGEQ